jgi:hypothetical protein
MREGGYRQPFKWRSHGLAARAVDGLAAKLRRCIIENLQDRRPANAKAIVIAGIPPRDFSPFVTVLALVLPGKDDNIWRRLSHFDDPWDPCGHEHQG